MRFHPCRGSMDLGKSQGGLPPDEVTEDRDAILQACAEAIDRFHDPAPDAMVRVALAPCSPFSVTKELMAETAEFARQRNVRLHTHMAETLDEEQFCLELFGVRPVEYLEQVGWLGDDVWLAHCVHLDEREVRRFGETGTGVAHCPSSNARLGAGIAPVAALTAAGAPVGLGVDGAASNEAGELAGELREALLVARIKGGPQALTAREALALGTIHGARCLGREDEIGSLEPGKLADVALWRLDDLDHAGIADPVAALVLGAAPDRRHAAGRRQARRRGRPAHHGRRGGDRARHRRREPPDAGGGRVSVETTIRGGIGESLRRPDGIPKVKGDFAYSSDLWADGMLWGSTLRSPHPRARIREINIAPALAIRGVFAVLTHEDVPGRKVYGLEIPDQPVLAFDQVRYQGEAVAIVAADHPETARHAASKIEVDYEVLEPVTDPEKAFDAEPLHPSGNLLRHVRIEHGDPSATAEVVVSGEYEVGMQDQAFLGPESGLAVPAEDGGVDLFVSTQWLHVDRDQTAASLDLPPEKVRITLGGVGGAFGGREDLSMQIHACMLALHTGKPVKMMYGREESFFGHIHRHPARMRYEHGATRDGDLVYVKCRILLDGGAYASSSHGGVQQRGVLRGRAVRGAERADRLLRRLHRQPAVRRDARLRRRADLLRPRGADGQAGGRAGDGPGRAAAPQRGLAGHGHPDRRAASTRPRRSPSCSTA